MRGPSPGKLSKVLCAIFTLNASILSVTTSWERLLSQCLQISALQDTTSPRIFTQTTFALNWIFCPSGPPWWTTEESAAHHLHQKTIKNILWNTLGLIVVDLGTFDFLQNFAHEAPRSKKIGHQKITSRRNEYIFLARYIPKILISAVIFTFHVHLVIIWCLKYFLSHICVEFENLPFGLPITNDRGECCAPEWSNVF